MDTLSEYAAHWFAHTALRLGQPHWLDLNATWITQVEAARPGFGTRLRAIALAALPGSNRELVHRALAVLAAIGGADDLPVVEPFGASSDSWIASAARTAAFEIQKRGV